MLPRSTSCLRPLRVRCVPVLCALAVATGCGTSAPAPGQAQDTSALNALYPDIPADAVPVSAAPIPELTRTQSPFEDPSTFVITDAGEWTRFLSSVGGPDGPPAEVAGVDVTSETVLAVAIGYRPSGGYAVEIEGVFTSGDDLYVAVLETRPGPGCMTSSVLTFPVTAVRVPAWSGSVRFVRRTVDRPCT